MATPLETTVNDAVLAAFPAAVTRFDGPLVDGTTWMEIIHAGKWVMVEWNPGLPFGVSRVIGTSGFDPNGVFADESAATTRILEILGT